jgi:hypothetical protein
MVIGIAVARDHVRILGLGDGKIRWASEAELTDEASLAPAIVELLAAAPIPAWPRPAAIAAIGPAFAQTKAVAGLPPLTDPDSLRSVIQESAGRFFLRNGIPLVTSGVRLIEPGRAWVAAFNLPVVHAVESACRTARVRLRGITSTAVVLGRAVQDDSVVWQDGSLAIEAEFADGALIGVRRRSAGQAAAPDAMSFGDESPRLAEPLADLGDAGWRFADAYGAALTPANEPILFRPGRATDREVPKWRLQAAATAFVVAVVAGLLAPGLAAIRAGDEARDRIATLAEEWRTAAAAESRLRETTAALGEVASFDASRRSVTLLLADLTRALPDGSALTSFQMDTTGGNLTALTPRAAGVLDALERVPGLVAPEIIGPVVRERVGERDLERVSLHFGIAKQDSTPRQPTEGGSQ